MLKSFFRKNGFYMLGFLILSWVVFVNLFPKGYVFAGGDTAQFIEAGNNFKSFFYDWEGRASLFYFLFYLLDLVGLNDTAQLSFYLGIFILGSYISFDIFARLFFRGLKPSARMLFSLFYALNVYTLYIFTANWGYSYFQFLYIFIPVLLVFYIKFFKTSSWLYLSWFVFFLFLASSGFANPAFAISFAIVLLAVLIFSILCGLVKFNRTLFYDLIILGVLSFLVNLYWIWPLIPQASGRVSGLYLSSVIDLNSWLTHTSNPIQNTLTLHHYSTDYYPDNFPYAKLYFLKDFFILLTFIPAALIFWGVLNMRNIRKEKRKYFLVFLGLLIFLVMLVARVRPPFEAVNHFLYNLWGMNTLRGYDKMAIFVPFILAVLMAIVFQELISEKNKKWLYTLILLILLIPLPFYFGKLQQNMSYRFSNVKPQNKDYRKSKISFLVKIPNEYYQIRNIINNDQEKSFVATLPFSPSDGSGIANYPTWKLYGVDITRYLYNKNFIEANANNFNQWNFSQNFNENYDGQYDWIVKLLGSMNAKYIIYHKDTTEDSVKQSEFKMKVLEDGGMIKKLNDNKYFNLYQINDDFIIPYITWQKEDINLEENSKSINKQFNRVKNSIESADFRQINPKKFEVNVESNQAEYIVLAESFNPNWKAYLVDKNGKEKEIEKHFETRGYANGWKVENPENISKIVIEYYPVRLMWRGIVISLVTLLFLVGYLLYYYYVQKNKAKA